MLTTEGLLLAGDIGGTKTTLALYASDSWPGPPLREQVFSNSQVDDLTSLIFTFLAEETKIPIVACFGVAGPVHEDRVRMTNLDWILDARKLEQECWLQRVFLINDLVATAIGAIQLLKDELVTINIGAPQAKGNIGVLAPGTGLGEAFVYQQDNTILPMASEGGHSSFSPRNPEQIALLQFLLKNEDHVSVEKVCSGLALPQLFAFLSSRMPAPKELQQELAAAADQTPILIRTALTALESGAEDHICIHMLRLFTDILAAEAANLALKMLTTGGIYIGGGLSPRIIPFFSSERFMHFFARGVYRKLLANIPVHIILNPHTALIGAAAYGMNQSLSSTEIL